MKKFSMFILSLAVCSAGFAQKDADKPASLGFSFTLNDYATAQKIRATSLSTVHRDKSWSKMRDMNQGIAVSYFRTVHSHVDFASTLSGTFTRDAMQSRRLAQPRFLLGLDVAANLKMFTDKYVVNPYLIAGIGGHMYAGKYFGASAAPGVGLKLNVFEGVNLFATSQYRIPVISETSNYYFFHQFGVAARVSKKKEPVVIVPPAPPVDTDKDGIVDSLDKCPTVPGIAKYQGCPIPDTDKDGINDEEDKCPNEAGVARYGGCPIPDTDKDGINDEEDKCITEAGPASNQGCPFKDTDGDGINDNEDRCPTLPGVKENQGCPAIQDDVVKKVNFAASNIYFATGKYTLLAKSNKGLNEVAKILQDNPGLNLAIDGHTDDVGKDESNQTLSENRANAVKKYLISKGVEESRLIATGHGETQPIADNKTAAGRQKNRRVELKLSYY